MNETEKLRKQIADMLAWGEAHQTLEKVVADFPAGAARRAPARAAL